jgi:C-terminal processing protease CtpA/Prc
MKKMKSPTLYPVLIGIGSLLCSGPFALAQTEPPEPGQTTPSAHEQKQLAGYLGVNVAPVQENLRAHLKLPRGTGLLVESVVPDSPAEKAGLQQHDILMKVDDQIVVNFHQFITLIRNRAAGDRVKLEILRAGQTQTLETVLEERPLSEMERRGPFPFHLPGLESLTETLQRIEPELRESFRELERKFTPQQVGYLGVSVEPVNETLALQLDLPENSGLTVRHVARNSPAEKAGVQQGDVLLEFNQTKLITPDQFASLVQAGKKGETVRLKLIRGGREQEIETELGEEARPMDFLKRFKQTAGEALESEQFKKQAEEASQQIRRKTEELRQRLLQERKRLGGSFQDQVGLSLGKGQFTLRTPDAIFNVSQQEDGKQLVITDRNLNTLFSGPINSQEDLEQVPEQLRPFLKFLQLFSPAEGKPNLIPHGNQALPRNDAAI